MRPLQNDPRRGFSLTIDLTENVAVGTVSNGTQYRISGQGQCRVPAVASGASINVSPLRVHDPGHPVAWTGAPCPCSFVRAL
jgi:hypothetical protein